MLQSLRVNIETALSEYVQMLHLDQAQFIRRRFTHGHNDIHINFNNYGFCRYSPKYRSTYSCYWKWNAIQRAFTCSRGGCREQIRFHRSTYFRETIFYGGYVTIKLSVNYTILSFSADPDHLYQKKIWALPVENTVTCHPFGLHPLVESKTSYNQKLQTFT